MNMPPYPDLDLHYDLDPEDILFFRQNGFIKLKRVLSADTLRHYGGIIAGLVQALNTQHLAMEARNTYQKAFLQVMNLWTQSEAVRRFVASPRLARIATQLMGTSGVRLYHDQALYKEPGGGPTPWHVDQHYWPLDRDHTCTAWIPLQDTVLEMGPLAFSAGSHTLRTGREFEIGDEGERRISKVLLERQLPLHEAPFELGEISFHGGWTFHRAGGNRTATPRQAMTIIYMDKDTRIVAPNSRAQQADLDRWCPGIQPGEIAASKLNPILYEND